MLPELPALKKALLSVIKTPLSDRLYYIMDALRAGATAAEVCASTNIDPWFIAQLVELLDEERALIALGAGGERVLDEAQLRRAETLGFSDTAIAGFVLSTAKDIRAQRLERGITPYTRASTAAPPSFAGCTPYQYSTWGDADEAEPGDRTAQGDDPRRRPEPHRPRHRVRLLLRARGVRAARARDRDHHGQLQSRDRLDRLRHQRSLLLRAVDVEDVMSIVKIEQPDAVIVQFGGQTPLKLAVPLARAGVKLLGTQAEAIDRAEDREKFKRCWRSCSCAGRAA